jgi:hypothetical protein
MKTEGATKLVCVIHEAGNVGLEDRCAGAARTFGGQVFRSLAGVANWMDPASTLGIMAVAVAPNPKRGAKGSGCAATENHHQTHLNPQTPCTHPSVGPEISRDELTSLMAGGAELEALSHELERSGDGTYAGIAQQTRSRSRATR